MAGILVKKDAIISSLYFELSTVLFEDFDQNYINFNFVLFRSAKIFIWNMIDKEEYRKRIIISARQIFSRYGFRKTTMDEMARP